MQHLSKKYSLLAILWFLITLYLLFKNFNDLELIKANSFIKLLKDWLPQYDKIVHCSIFFIQTYLLLKIPKVKQAKFTIVVLLLLVIWAIYSEVLQALYTANRSGDSYDSMADMLGIALAYIAYRVLKI